MAVNVEVKPITSGPKAGHYGVYENGQLMITYKRKGSAKAEANRRRREHGGSAS